MRHEQLSRAEAIEVCSVARPSVRPRDIFLRDLENFANSLLEKARDHAEEEQWDLAVRLANAETVAILGCRDVTCRQEVQAECRRLLIALENWCIREAFGEARETRSTFQEAARSAVTSYARTHGWIKLSGEATKIDSLPTGMIESSSTPQL